ncbi:virulence protein [Eubacteriales bacterium OttesenSCG-928-K08]|nr:virulence protein [Eubacteriales bacterium OttesenSCG-928-K08]
MHIFFQKTGAERKALVTAIGEILDEKPQYMGAPGFAFSIGGYTITKDGTLEYGEQEAERIPALLSALAERGFVPVDAPEFTTDEADMEREPTTAEVADTEPEAKAVDNIGTELDGIFAIALSSEGMAGQSVENLRKLVLGKALLIRTALGENLAEDADALPVVFEDGKVSFPWFRLGMDADTIAAWSFFVAALCETAKKQKRVIMSEKPYDGSEKYAMRCFLLKLGFIGEEYKQARSVILAGLSGDGSHKRPKEAAQVGSITEQAS